MGLILSFLARGLRCSELPTPVKLLGWHGHPGSDFGGWILALELVNFFLPAPGIWVCLLCGYPCWGWFSSRTKENTHFEGPLFETNPYVRCPYPIFAKPPTAATKPPDLWPPNTPPVLAAGAFLMKHQEKWVDRMVAPFTTIMKVDRMVSEDYPPLETAPCSTSSSIGQRASLYPPILNADVTSGHIAAALIHQ